MKRLFSLVLVVTALGSLTSCWPLILGAGVTAGYMARDNGYEVHAPVTKE